jgi:hypothetical protein
MLKLFSKKIVLASSILLCFGCVADLVLIYIFGKQIKGYSQLSCTISSMGESSSPVSRAVTIWSVFLGTIFILFGFCFREVYLIYGKVTNKIFLLIVLYGFGENIASGIFKADYINGSVTLMAIVHNLLGGVGVIALLLLPLMMTKIFTRESSPGFFIFSRVIFTIGIFSILLFSFRVFNLEITFINSCKGLWQRIFLVNFYIYFITIAIKMIRNRINNPLSLNNYS